MEAYKNRYVKGGNWPPPPKRAKTATGCSVDGVVAGVGVACVLIN